MAEVEEPSAAVAVSRMARLDHTQDSPLAVGASPS